MVVTSVFGSGAEATDSTVRDAGVPRTVVAQPGDTLWAIARRVMPEGNINPLVAQLVALNGATITVGQQVRIP
jgi:nucleoid-associated protein YgaU